MRKRETHLINEYGDRVTIQRTLPLDEEIKKLNESTNSNFHLDIEWYLSNGYVKYKIEHCSNYVLTQALLNEEIDNSFDIEKIIIIVQAIIILFMICYYIFIDKKLFSKKKNVENKV